MVAIIVCVHHIVPVPTHSNTQDMLDDLDSGYPRGVGAEEALRVSKVPVHGDVDETIEAAVNDEGW